MWAWAFLNHLLLNVIYCTCGSGVLSWNLMAVKLVEATDYICQIRFAVLHLCSLRYRIWSIIMSILFDNFQTSHRNWLQILCPQNLGVSWNLLVRHLFSKGFLADISQNCSDFSKVSSFFIMTILIHLSQNVWWSYSMPLHVTVHCLHQVLLKEFIAAPRFLFPAIKFSHDLLLKMHLLL